MRRWIKLAPLDFDQNIHIEKVAFSLQNSIVWLLILKILWEKKKWNQRMWQLERAQRSPRAHATLKMRNELGRRGRAWSPRELLGQPRADPVSPGAPSGAATDAKINLLKPVNARLYWNLETYEIISRINWKKPESMLSYYFISMKMFWSQLNLNCQSAQCNFPTYVCGLAQHTVIKVHSGFFLKSGVSG